MISFRRKVFKYVFTITCAIAVAGVAGYWVYKYRIEDRDIGVVDYLSLEEAEDVDFPDLSICLINPFSELKLNAISPEFNSSSYLDYLKGNRFNISYESIPYENVSLDMNDYFLHATETWMNNTDVMLNSSQHIDHKYIFTGFNSYGQIMKCFSIQTNVSQNRYIQKIGVHYDTTKFIADWNNILEPKVKFGLKFHLPGQFFVGDEPEWFEWFLVTDPPDIFRIGVYELEIIKRRNSRNKQCSEDSKTYDENILMRHVSKQGCRAPSLNVDDTYQLCKTARKIKESRMSYAKVKLIDYPKPCHRISKIRLWDETETNVAKELTFYISYPEEFKVITQSKEVDIHGLIGNVGGYIGLFLGNFHNT